jgi:four helix bundle protein
MADRITSFTQLRTWQNARELAVEIYKKTENFPSSEKFDITSQIRRSSVSIPANIAEGFSRSGRKDKIHFYAIALGSLTETISHVYIAQDLGFLHQKDIELIEEKGRDLHKMINGLMKSAQEKHT